MQTRLRPPDAGTYWYHPHVNSLEQIGSGLAGVLIVDEHRPPDVDRDETLIIQEFFVRNRDDRLAVEEVYGPDQREAQGGMRYLLAVNGKLSSALRVGSGERVRLRLLNVGPFSSFAVALPGASAWIMALDGMPLATPAPLLKGCWLAPGQRMDLVIDAVTSAPLTLTPDTGLVSQATPWRLDVNGARRDQNRTGPLSLERNEVAVPVLRNALPLTLRLGRGFPSPADERAYNQALEQGIDPGWRKPWSLNDRAMRETLGVCGASAPLFKLRHGQSYVMEIVNPTDEPHPIHMHGHSFHVLAENGRKLATPLVRDTVYVLAGGRNTIAFVADNPGRWMLHCHTAGHQITGMMGVMEVS
jgi:FtsP/CotA-like multicopper oxidase with cupredoxin domain